MFSNQDSQGPSLFSAPGWIPGLQRHHLVKWAAWQDIALFFLRLYFAFGTPRKICVKLGTAKSHGEDFFATFRCFFATIAACPSHAGKKK
jgi:hypothetical protein